MALAARPNRRLRTVGTVGDDGLVDAVQPRPPSGAQSVRFSPQPPEPKRRSQETEPAPPTTKRQSQEMEPTPPTADPPAAARRAAAARLSVVERKPRRARTIEPGSDDGARRLRIELSPDPLTKPGQLDHLDAASPELRVPDGSPGPDLKQRNKLLLPAVPGKVGISKELSDQIRALSKDRPKDRRHTYSLAKDSKEEEQNKENKVVHRRSLRHRSRHNMDASGSTEKHIMTTPNGKHEQIVVKEADLKRYGNNLKLLRMCSLPADADSRRDSPDEDDLDDLQRASSHQEGATLEKPKTQYQADYEAQCRTAADLRDEWKEHSVPEAVRGPCEQDYIMNQVWIPPDKVKDRTRRRVIKPNMDIHYNRTVKNRVRLPDLERDEDELSDGATASESVSPMPPPTPDVDLLRDPAGDPQERRDSRPGSERSSQRSLLDGSLTIPSADRPHRVWLVLEMQSGKVQPYPSEVAERIDDAFQNFRQSVPLNGLGEMFEHCIVHFETAGSAESVWEKAANGIQRSVCCIDILEDTKVVCAYIQKSAKQWKFVDSASVGAHTRYVMVTGENMIRPDARNVRPVPKRDALSFMNPGAFEPVC